MERLEDMLENLGVVMPYCAPIALGLCDAPYKYNFRMGMKAFEVDLRI